DELEESLHSSLVRGIGRADELVIGDAEQTPDLLRALGDRVYQLLWRDSSFRGSLRDFLAVLVHAHQKVDRVSLETVIPGDDVGADLLIGVSLMRIRGGVVDRGGEVVLGQLLAAG